MQPSAATSTGTAPVLPETAACMGQHGKAPVFWVHGRSCGRHGRCSSSGIRGAAGTEQLRQQLLLTISPNAHVCVFVMLFGKDLPFTIIKLITHMWEKVVPQPVMGEKTYKSL